MKPKGLPLRIAAKIAWREGRASAVKFAFVIIAVAIGVGALTAVRGFSRAFQGLLLREARTLMAGDLAVRTFMLPTDEQNRAMDELEKQGIQSTWITEVISMAAASEQRPPTLVGVKAVDPSKYPFYGTLRLEPASDFKQMGPEEVAVSEDLLMRLEVHVGDTIRIGGKPFRIRGELAAEPDRMVGNLNVGPRVMMTRDGLDRSGLILPGSRAAERFLFRLPPTTDVKKVREDLKKAFPEGQIADFREAHPILSRGLDQATTFLSLVSLVSLIVGSLGVATAINTHLNQRLDSIAIMKCVGARSGHIMRIYLIQTLALGFAGGVIGVVAAAGALPLAAPAFLERLFSVKLTFGLDWRPALEGIGIGVMTSLLFTVPPLLSIRRIRPGLIFRREMAETKPTWRDRLRRGQAAIVTGVILVVGMGAIAAALTVGSPNDRMKVGGFFVGALVVSLSTLTAIAWILLRVLRVVSRRMGRAPAPIRHGIANLYRPGNHAEAVLVALGVGVMFTLTVYLIQGGLIADMNRTAPPGMPNLFLLDVAAKNVPGVLGLLKQQKGIEQDPVLMGTSAAKLNSINGTSIDNVNLQGFGRRFRFTRQVTSERAKPPYVDVLQGAWWTDPDGPPRVCITEDTSKTLKIGPGTKLDWTIAGQEIKTEVACVVKIDPVHLIGRLDFIFNPGALKAAPVVFYGSVRVQASEAAALQLAMYRSYPMVTVINVADVLRIVQQVVNQIGLQVRIISGFAILAGIIILAASVAGTRFRRIREVVILKTLGATRGKVATVFSMEFLILGLVAGVMGSGLASAFSNLILKKLMRAEYFTDPWANALAIGATASVAIAAGWAASFRILGQKPLEALRDE